MPALALGASRPLSLALFLILVASVLSSCGTGPVVPACDDTTCSGCCDANGACQAGTTSLDCGTHGNQCRTCGSGEKCEAAVCVVACVPATCASLGKNCGTVADGCGGTLNCGGCTAVGESCGAGGPNLCGAGTCTPKDCAALNATCGQVSDGCSMVLACGSCTAPQTCTVSNTCACTPGTCASLGKNCGTLSDGCGGMLTCGTCAAPQACGGAGVGNVCGTGTCVPKTCAGEGKTCGSISDGCGGTLTCGTCSASQMCLNNVCGGCVVTTSCAAQNKNCGALSDGCGGTLACGSCTGFQTCTANVCTATCVQTCPSGFTCNAMGVCAGGNVGGLVLDVLTTPVVTVGGTVTQKGARPASTSSNPCARIHFDNTANADDVTAYACASTPTAPLAFTNVSLFAGTYKVTVADYNSSTSLPSPEQLVNAALVVTVSTTTLVLDVNVGPPVTLAGTVTHNGARPVSTSSNPCARVVFQNKDPAGESVTAYACASTPTAAFAFTNLSIFPGTYDVDVADYNNSSALPDTEHSVKTAFVVGAAATGLVFDVVTTPVLTVGGTVTQKGIRPASTSSNPCARIHFDNLANADDVTAYACASTATAPLTFTNVSLFAGTYKVTVADYNSSTSLPAPDQTVYAMLNLTASSATLVLDVNVGPPVTLAGTVTHNGARPVSTSSNPCARVVFQNKDPAGESVTAYACASTPTAAFAFTNLSIFPGTYDVDVADYNNSSALPDTEHSVKTAFVVGAAATGLVFDVVTTPVLTVGGTVTQKGIRPGSTSSNPCARIHFDNLANADDVTAYACASTATAPLTFTNVSLFAGTYKVTVADYNSSTSLPAPDQLVNAMLVLNASTTTLTLDVNVGPPTTIAGTVLHNGARPVSTSSNPCARISFANLDATGESVTAYACANTPTAAFAFTNVSIFPGVYRVAVADYNASCSLPDTEHDVIGRLLIP